MAISVFDIVKIGVGPSSSHTFGSVAADQRLFGEPDGNGFSDDAAASRRTCHAPSR